MHRSVCIDLDLSVGLIDLVYLEQAALDFARRAPGELVAAAVQVLTGELFDVIIDLKGFALADYDAQPEAPWACTRRAPLRSSRAAGQGGLRPGVVLRRSGSGQPASRALQQSL